MTGKIQSTLIVTKANDPEAIDFGRNLAGVLAGRGVATDLCEHRQETPGSEANNDGQPYQLIFVLGGDGTLLSVARRMISLGVPLVGINLGQLGFLCELTRDNCMDALDALLGGQAKVSRRSVLDYRVMRGGREVTDSVAVNDVVISREILARLIRMGIRIDGEYIGSIRADGLIASTPTGSSAYGISAGGGLVHPDVPALCLTPVCPFLSSFRPLVLPDESEVVIIVEEGRGGVSLTEDGQEIFALKTGDEVVITRSEHDLLLADMSSSSYFERLKLKGFLMER